jgi:hypothetical protein
VWLWPDHLTCPDLERWLPSELADATVRTHVVDAKGWALPSGLRDLVQRWDPWQPDDAELDAIVVFGPLGRGVPAEVVPAVAASGRIVEVGTVARTVRWWLRPWAWKREATTAAASRIVQWAHHGLYDLEQYVALTPCDAVVTLGYVAP